jgi:bifunctional DNA-binding transcriptional regulator/antitoxin component of YhaV-PrlF toxin-antitoxin module
MPVRHVKIAPGGRVVLPAEFRKALEVSVGDSVVIAGRRADPRDRRDEAAREDHD